MAPSLALPRPMRQPRIAALAAIVAVLCAVLAARVLVAQVEGDRGIAPVAASRDIDVGGIDVDVTAENAIAAQEKGWREAQRKAWAKLGGPSLPDSRIESMVSAVVIEHEQIGPRRYIARLGVIFDRARAGSVLGAAGARTRSAPMLLVPVTVSGGASTVYQVRNPWQAAWAEFQSGASPIDYVRPSGAGGDSLLLTYGQVGRRSRTWWRGILDQFGAADVLVPIARLEYSYPGGPINGTFTARYGPDNVYLGEFTLQAKNPQDLPRMLASAVERFDAIFAKALADGKLKPDPTLALGTGEGDPALQKLISIGRQIEARERAKAAAAAAPSEATTEPGAPTAAPTPTGPAVVSNFVVQFATPDGGAFDSTLAVVRSTPGVRGVAITSTAMGGTSVMRVSFGGSLEQLAAALRSRGFNVNQGSNALAISR
ncbi:MAG: heavy-metal-associated domain-containing protein [Sphingomonadales bacterium]|nr:heavy-metal-associated domain-containing protein [Sphingomonadales bacterium]MBD3772556.1 heavy-metal-associated domain-containing protein [Paracoccaceae bacterium]